MTIDIFTATGTKKGTLDLPAELFEARINRGLIHQAIERQRSNLRNPIAHAKNRHEVAGSTRKLYAQKHTGRARRGSSRSPLLRGGGKAFGPRSEANFEKDMPRSMRRAALAACLSLQAKNKVILGLESYPQTIKTKDFLALMKKLPLDVTRRLLIVIPEKHEPLWLSSRNLPGVKTLLVSYLNPVDVVGARAIVFVGDSIDRALKLFGTKSPRLRQEREPVAEVIEEKKPAKKAKVKVTAKKEVNTKISKTAKSSVGVRKAKKATARSSKEKKSASASSK